MVVTTPPTAPSLSALEATIDLVQNLKVLLLMMGMPMPIFFSPNVLMMLISTWALLYVAFINSLRDIIRE